MYQQIANFSKKRDPKDKRPKNPKIWPVDNDCRTEVSRLREPIRTAHTEPGVDRFAPTELETGSCAGVARRCSRAAGQWSCTGLELQREPVECAGAEEDAQMKLQSLSKKSCRELVRQLRQSC